MRKAQIYIKKHEKTLKNRKNWGVSSPNWGGIYPPLGGGCKNITVSNINAME